MQTTDAMCDADWHAATVARVLAGDIDAYGELVARHRDRCLRHAYHMLGDRDEAEDVAQEAFVRAYRYLARCEAPARFGAWLFSILVNRCRTAGERQARRDRLFTSAGAVDADLWAETQGETLQDDSSLSPEQIEKALRHLSAVQREAFLLKHVDEMSYEDISILTGARLSALKMRVSRARDILRAHLTEVYDE